MMLLIIAALGPITYLLFRAIGIATYGWDIAVIGTGCLLGWIVIIDVLLALARKIESTERD